MVEQNSFTIFDPIHKVIRFEGSVASHIHNIVDLEEFQRLRKIKQLSLYCALHEASCSVFFILQGLTGKPF